VDGVAPNWATRLSRLRVVDRYRADDGRGDARRPPAVGLGLAVTTSRTAWGTAPSAIRPATCSISLGPRRMTAPAGRRCTGARQPVPAPATGCRPMLWCRKTTTKVAGAMSIVVAVPQVTREKHRDGNGRRHGPRWRHDRDRPCPARAVRGHARAAHGGHAALARGGDRHGFRIVASVAGRGPRRASLPRRGRRRPGHFRREAEPGCWTWAPSGHRRAGTARSPR
jgi:hypothetical protein